MFSSPVPIYGVVLLFDNLFLGSRFSLSEWEYPGDFCSLWTFVRCGVVKWERECRVLYVQSFVNNQIQQQQACTCLVGEIGEGVPPN